MTPKALEMCLYPKHIHVKGFATMLPVPCGKCMECLQQHSTEWAYRIMLESKYYTENCFITLTYEVSPVNLVKRDLQLFIKRLRKRLAPRKIRYFACGEYGSKIHTQRPHYHIIIFNWFPDDIFAEVPGKDKLFRSKLLEECWTKGFSSVGNLDFDSAKYCAKYMQKLNDYDGLVKPFTLMSTKPGLSFNFINDKGDTYLLDDKIYHNGHYIKLPRYFIKVLERQGYDLELFKLRRYKNALSFQPNDYDFEAIELKEKELKQKRKKERNFKKGY